MAIDWDTAVLGPTVAVFGQAVIYTPAGSNSPISAIGGGPITGVFDDAYIDQNQIDGVEANAVKPVLGVRMAQFAVPPAQDDTVLIGGTTYIVKDVRPDGHGWALLFLQVMA